jgi:hypothetical protein
MHDGFDGIRRDRLREVVVESRRESALAILHLAPAGHGDERDAGTPVAGAHSTRYFIPIEVGQSNVEQDDLRMEFPADLQRLGAVVGFLDLMARKLEH